MHAGIARRSKNGKSATRINGTKGHRYQGGRLRFVDGDIIALLFYSWVQSVLAPFLD